MHALLVQQVGKERHVGTSATLNGVQARLLSKEHLPFVTNNEVTNEMRELATLYQNEFQ